MHTRHPFVLATALTFWIAGLAAAASPPRQSTAAPTRILPVFVQVSPQGKIVTVTPADKLDAAMTRLVRKTLAAMITQPAHDAQGHAIASQFIIKLSVKTTRTPDGGYAARLSYVSAQPVSAGQWHWIHAGKKVALARQDFIEPHSRRDPTACVEMGDGGAGAHRGVFMKHGVAQTEGDPCGN